MGMNIGIKDAKRIYLDYASLTPVDRRVLAEMKKYSGGSGSTVGYANPSSIYKEGVAAKKAMEDGRTRVAGFLNAHADEIIFTSGGTEANSLALEGVLRAARRGGNARPHLVISNIEHSSIMETAAEMERQGVEVTRLAVDASGRVSPEELEKAIKPETLLVSLMIVNNETGSIQPIREIAKAVRHAREQIMPLAADGTRSRYPLLHTDAAQAAAYSDLNVEQLGVDLLTLDAGKAYGPRGIGALYVRRGAPIEPAIHGGGQEHGLRSGTENVPAIMGFAKALDIVSGDHMRFGTKNVSKCIGVGKEASRIQALKKAFFEGLKKLRPDVKLNPPGTGIESPSQAPNILNVSIPGIDNEFFVLQLDAHGIAASTKSSCLRDAEGSYVLRAIGADSGTSVRFSFGRWTKRRDVAKTLRVIAKILSF